jgi:lysyl-tRNA synthetase, class II
LRSCSEVWGTIHPFLIFALSTTLHGKTTRHSLIGKSILMALSEQEKIRREGLAKLKEMGIDPYPPQSLTITHHAKDIQKHFEQDAKGFENVSVAGRLMMKRIMGKASFAELQDSSGRIQLYINRDEICPDEDKSLYNDVFKKLLDIGDYIWVEGFAFLTQTEEKTIHVKSLKLISKSIRPLPIVKRDAEGNVFDAFTDPEQRYSMRYVDLTVNPEFRDVFVKRSRMISAMRRFFDNKGLAGSGNAHSPAHPRRRGGAAFQDAPQHARHAALPAHRQRALPQAPHRGRLRRGV